jgi:hypothetical protein
MFPSELEQLKRSNIDLEKLEIITTKQTFYFPLPIKHYIEKYFKEEEETINAFNTTHYEIQRILVYMHKYNPESKYLLTLDILKNSIAVLLARKGADIRLITALTSLSAEKVYALYRPLTNDKMRKKYKQLITAKILQRR